MIVVIHILNRRRTKATHNSEVDYDDLAKEESD